MAKRKADWRQKKQSGLRRYLKALQAASKRGTVTSAEVVRSVNRTVVEAERDRAVYGIDSLDGRFGELAKSMFAAKR